MNSCRLALFILFYLFIAYLFVNKYVIEVYGVDVNQNNAGSLNNMELLVKKKIVRNKLLIDGKVDVKYLKDLIASKISLAVTDKATKEYLLYTNKNGFVQENIDAGLYLVKVDPILDMDITASKSVLVEKAKATDILIIAKQRNGTVKKTSTLFDLINNLTETLKADVFSTVYAKNPYDDDLEEDYNSPLQIDHTNTGGISRNQGIVRITAAVSTSNSVSKNDKLTSLGGLKITLTKANQQTSISLTRGWNLITLTSLPNSPLTVSSLLTSITQQGGYATTVSKLEDGAWKTYVKRGETDYSGDDFVIEAGKAYFVKVLKPLEFKFAGQEFVAPIKTKLTSGWNAVGLPKAKKSYQASSLIDEINTKNGGADAASRWQYSLWDTLVKKDQQKYGKDFVIESNKGYLIRSDKGGEFEF